ncbi:hypothetical protein DFH09DRAFT_357596 [Mycena vulgaris]|nr:hypothetical protein DFH09DRAFT_357596 [Mycena vulgaris]
MITGATMIQTYTRRRPSLILRALPSPFAVFLLLHRPGQLMVDTATIIIDDTALLNLSLDDINLGDTGGWFTTESSTVDDGFPSNYNNTNFIPDFTPWGQGAWLFPFEGTSVSLFGITPPLPFSQTLGVGNSMVPHVNITNPKAYTNHTYRASSYGGQFYTSGSLASPSQIKIGITGARGLVIDYALVTIGEFTDLQGQTILVDDSSPEIIWNGNWTIRANYTVPVPCQLPFMPRSDDVPYDFTANMAPHGNSSRFSTDGGDSFTFQFAGTSISVSGITPADDKGQDWLLRMEFTLDGNTTTTTFTRDPSYVTKPHFSYFTSGPLKPGNHTLLAKITDVAGAQLPAAHIDYITYTPSFLTLRDKPNFGSSVANNTQSSGTPTPVPSHAVTPAEGGQSHSSAGAIAGGVVGGCCVLGILLWLLWRKVWKKNGRDTDEGVAEPFALQPSIIGVPNNRSQISPRVPHPTGLSSPSPQDPPALEDHGRASVLVPGTDNVENHSPERRDSQALENRIRELESLAREMRHHIVPPSYEGGN